MLPQRRGRAPGGADDLNGADDGRRPGRGLPGRGRALLVAAAAGAAVNAFWLARSLGDADGLGAIFAAAGLACCAAPLVAHALRGRRDGPFPDDEA